jgi:protein tyrosine phosphatase (PTP) superfamily phosphohydrolase (DUF442 family)
MTVEYAVESLGMKYIHIPVQFSSPSAGDLQKFFSVMDTHKTEILWIHCAANKRVPVFLGLYRINKLGWKYENAFALMSDLWVPNDIWTAFINAMLKKL